MKRARDVRALHAFDMCALIVHVQTAAMKPWISGQQPLSDRQCLSSRRSINDVQAVVVRSTALKQLPVERLVLHDLGDGAHGALFQAVAARDAGVLVHRVGHAANHFQDLLGTSVNADATADALVGNDNRMGHDRSFSTRVAGPRRSAPRRPVACTRRTITRPARIA